MGTEHKKGFHVMHVSIVPVQQKAEAEVHEFGTRLLHKASKILTFSNRKERDGRTS